MKTLLLSTLLLFTTLAFGQKTVVLSIDHKLEGDEFELRSTKTNASGDEYEVTRLEYYLAEFELVHDGGQITQLPDTWLLVDGSQEADFILGDFNLTQLEEIRFYNGVDQDHNHLDPTTYPAGHPLGHKNPSMHWGWTAGYRFLAIEGNVGPSLAYHYEIHALGDRNYRQVTLPTIGRESNDTIYVELEAFVEAIFREIDISAGVVAHGELDEAEQSLINLQSHVFAAVNPPLGLLQNEAVSKLYLINPSQLGSIQVFASEPMNVSVINTLGQEVLSTELEGLNFLPIQEAGVYFVNSETEAGDRITQKIIVR
jgi:hypothetical protein